MKTNKPNKKIKTREQVLLDFIEGNSNIEELRKGFNMKKIEWIAIGFLLFDFISVGIPFGALIFAYVVFFKPSWFKQLVSEIYGK